MRPRPGTEAAARLQPAVAVAPGVKLLLVQGVGVALWLALLLPLLGAIGVHPAAWQQAFGAGVLAAALGRVWGLGAWWVPINLFFVPGMFFMRHLELSSDWYLGGFALLLLVYWSVARSRVPLYLSSRKAWGAVADLLPQGAVLADLGSGLGGMLVHLSRSRPDCAYVGIENAPLPFLIGWLRARLGGTACAFTLGSLWHAELTRFDVVYAYLSPVPMADLWRKVLAEMRPGTLFISNSFAVPDVEPSGVVELDDLHRSRLYLYRL